MFHFWHMCSTVTEEERSVYFNGPKRKEKIATFDGIQVWKCLPFKMIQDKFCLKGLRKIEIKYDRKAENEKGKKHVIEEGEVSDSKERQRKRLRGRGRR